MKWIKMTGLTAVAVSILALSADQAAAQYTPTLSVSVSGVAVTIDWTSINEAQAYNIEVGTAPGAANIGQITLPASIARPIVVHAPYGVYYLRVRAVAGPYFGPFSNEAVASVPSGGGGGGCTPPAAPVATASVSGPNVTINWGPVANAAGYQVQFGQAPGANELAFTVDAGTLSKSQYIPMLGTFYARVVAGNQCYEISTSAEVPFTITTLAGQGPRTPDPPPGQVLPPPTYGGAVAAAVGNQYRGDLNNSCSNDIWLFRLVQALRQYDSRWGLNWKRKIVGDMSHDIVNYNFSAESDEGTTQVYSFDTILGHCGPSPQPKFENITNPNGAGAKWTLQPYLLAGFPPDPQ